LAAQEEGEKMRKKALLCCCYYQTTKKKTKMAVLAFLSRMQVFLALENFAATRAEAETGFRHEKKKLLL